MVNEEFYIEHFLDDEIWSPLGGAYNTEASARLALNLVRAVNPTQRFRLSRRTIETKVIEQ